MPRTLNATLQAALDSGNFQPYFLLTVREVGGSIIETAAPTYFKLSGIKLTLKWARTQGEIYSGYTYPHDLEFKVTRGVTIAGVNYTTDSSYYFGTSQIWDGIFQTVEACMLPPTRYTTPGDDTYENILTEICIEYNKTAVFQNPSAAWLDYQFLGDGKVLTLNRAETIINMIKQKYLIYACDNGSDQILFTAIATDDLSFVTPDHTLVMGRFKEASGDVGEYRRFLYRDELAVVHYFGDATDPLWNLGYLESTASPPTLTHSEPLSLEAIAPHLKYLSFDKFKFTMGNYPNYSGFFVGKMQVTEEYNYELKSIAWRILLQSFHWAKGTEGGALPGTIEAAAPYTPLNTSHFAGVLSTNDNNIQAAMETIDDHAHAGDMAAQIHAAGSASFSGNDDNEMGFWDFATGLLKKDTWQTIVLDIQNLFMSVFADGFEFISHTHNAGTTPKLSQANTHQSPDTDTGTSSLHHTIGTGANQAAAGNKGVTNGDSHNHVGGDGAALNYTAIIPAHGLNATIAAGATMSTPPYYYGLNAARFNFTVDRAGTLELLSMWTNTAQPGTGTLVATVIKNNAASALTITFAAGAGSSYVQDTTHTVTVAAGDLISIDIKNNAATASAQVNGLTIGFRAATT